VNLISNAEKYSPEVKKIEVVVGRQGGLAAISVSDRGIGVTSGEARRIFDEFYRVDDSLTSEVKGAGLGLTIARKIVADHGGDIRYAAREGGGSTFTILLPPAPEEKRG
jgi:signal transduction histidine kinase